MYKKNKSEEMQTLKKVNLRKFREELQELITNIGSSDDISFVDRKDEISFLKQYKEYIKDAYNVYPRFIFNEYDEEKFTKCVIYLNAGHTLLETEKYYESLMFKLGK